MTRTVAETFGTACPLRGQTWEYPYHRQVSDPSNPLNPAHPDYVATDPAYFGAKYWNTTDWMPWSGPDALRTT